MNILSQNDRNDKPRGYGPIPNSSINPELDTALERLIELTVIEIENEIARMTGDEFPLVMDVSTSGHWLAAFSFNNGGFRRAFHIEAIGPRQLIRAVREAVRA